jgi:hypothetical protein
MNGISWDAATWVRFWPKAAILLRSSWIVLPWSPSLRQWLVFQPIDHVTNESHSYLL